MKTRSTTVLNHSCPQCLRSETSYFLKHSAFSSIDGMNRDICLRIERPVSQCSMCNMHTIEIVKRHAYITSHPLTTAQNKIINVTKCCKSLRLMTFTDLCGWSRQKIQKTWRYLSTFCPDKSGFIAASSKQEVAHIMTRPSERIE